MKRFLLSVLFVLVLMIGIGAGIGGCSKPEPAAKPQPRVVMRVLDPSLEQYSVMWQHEVERRFDNAVVILCHGGDFVEGQWVAGDVQYRSGPHIRPMTAVVQEAMDAQPGRTVVLLACNTGHVGLGIPGVYYAKSSVWCVPDRDVLDATLPEFKTTFLFGQRAKAAAAARVSKFSRWSEDPDLVGNIFEFVTDGE